MNKRLCKCGCGTEVTSSRKQTVFIHGHNNRGVELPEYHRLALLNANIGKPKSPETTEKIRQKMLGRSIHTVESKRKIGEGSRKNWANGTFRTEEMIAKKSEAHKKSWASGKRKEAPPPTNVKHPSHGSPTRYKNIVFRSKLEARTAKIMDKYGVKWIYEPKRFILPECTYKPDFYLPEFNIWLEVKWDKNDPGLSKPYSLRKLGYKVTIVTHIDIKQLEDSCCD